MKGGGSLHSTIPPCCGMDGDRGGAVISDGAVANTVIVNEERCKQTIGVEHAL